MIKDNTSDVCHSAEKQQNKNKKRMSLCVSRVVSDGCAPEQDAAPPIPPCLKLRKNLWVVWQLKLTAPQFLSSQEDHIV